MSAEKAAKPKVSIIAAISKAYQDIFAEDPKVITLGEDLADPEGGGIAKITKGLSTSFGDDRVRSTPISEQAIMGAAIGASLAGYKPIAEIMLMNFTTVAMDMIVNHAAKLRFMSGGQTSVPIVIRTMTGLGYGSGGQHCDYLETWFAHTAGIKVCAASTPEDAYGLLRSAVEDPDPVIFIENLPTYHAPMAFELPDSSHRVPLGKAAIQREGSDVTLIAYARMAVEARAAAVQAAEQGVSVEVIDLRTIAPWDRETVLASARKTGRVLIAHEAVKEHGVGAEIAAVINEELFGALKKPVKRLGGAFSAVPYSKPLETAYAPDAARILAAIIELAK
ncbi:transketolase C-terminal domain-containing protein [Novosphingobium sp.]|jgi:pyruvate/2-oxoglutarate/acetoin dehydrogenase E1 component|uniref:alpha-ketoacid dehydrogenase subunit beta n=1 Tax=Novosphingobium sp. TaxID=1874826 RepID=UPI001EC0C736|nr:transketolase C-terminal domain-containing protein [Novosphingobium sp.]MBK6803097.1 alpha-ketoacid dehydrogenase subunit beta [Novosphingobium sp.]MBK9012053.1 alpha-ketoacid dehydrogenase subunit beta [Novosphingobium sp.]